MTSNLFGVYRQQRKVINQANAFRYMVIDVVYCGQYRRLKMSAVLELFVFVLRNANYQVCNATQYFKVSKAMNILNMLA